jgi:hypothetical protein
MSAVSAWDKHCFVKNVAECVRTFPANTQILIIAHAAYESGWGKTKQAQQAFNLFNVSAGSSWKGPTMEGGDLEFGAGGVKKIVQKWRCYGSMGEAVGDYLHLLELPRYLPARAALMDGDGARFIEWLGPDRAHQNPPLGGYFTLSTTTYLRCFSAVVAEVTALIDEGGQKEPRL